MEHAKSADGAPRQPEFEPLCLDKLKWHSREEIPGGVLVLDYTEMMEGLHLNALRKTLADGNPFYIENYGVTESDAESVFNVTRDFFNQPEEQKTKMVHPELPLILRGYSAYGTGAYENSLNEGKAINQYSKYAWGPSNNIYTNMMFKQAFDNMFTKLSAVASGVVDCIGHALGLKMHDQWQNLFDGENTVLHCQFYYPERSLEGDRMIPHADASVVTLLNQLPAEGGHVGLKAKLGEEFVGIPEIRGTLVVMVGESLNAMTNGRARPVIHAVTGPTRDVERSERGSMPFFLNPRNAFEMPRPAETTHGKFYNSSGVTTFDEYSQNIARAYVQTEGARV